MRYVHKDKEINEALVPIFNFAEMYNKSLPVGFPKASSKALKEFQVAYPALFKGGDDNWSIDKHRKRFMDWNSTRTA